MQFLTLLLHTIVEGVEGHCAADGGGVGLKQHGVIGLQQFLDAYEDSIDFMEDEDNRAEAAALIAKYGIAPNDKIAAKAIPQASLTFEDGDDMKEMLVNYYNVLMKADPKSIGGALPTDDFYYGVD